MSNDGAAPGTPLRESSACARAYTSAIPTATDEGGGRPHGDAARAFGQPTQSELLAEDARPAVAEVTRETLAAWAAANPDAAAAVLAKAAEAPARRRR